MRIDETQLGAAVAVAPVGRVDSTTAPALETHLFGLVDRGARALLVDFAGVDYISSAGLRVMLLLARRLRDQRGRLTLCSLNDAVRQVFELAGFLQLFAVCDSRAAAAAHLEAP